MAFFLAKTNIVKPLFELFFCFFQFLFLNAAVWHTKYLYTEHIFLPVLQKQVAPKSVFPQ